MVLAVNIWDRLEKILPCSPTRTQPTWLWTLLQYKRPVQCSPWCQCECRWGQQHFCRRRRQCSHRQCCQRWCHSRSRQLSHLPWCCNRRNSKNDFVKRCWSHSLTRFCEISPLWQNLQSLGLFLDDWFTLWQIFEPTLANFAYYCANFHWCKLPNVKNNLAIWSPANCAT